MVVSVSKSFIHSLACYCQGTLLARLLSGCVDLFLSSLAFFQLLQILPSFHTENLCPHPDV